MMNIKKEVIILYIFLLLISSSSVFADDVGCCINPGAGQLACSADRLILRDHECCPIPENNFPSYYRSAQNPSNPNNSNDCITNFFFSGKSCATVNACALGCCCSQLGGTITSGPQCKATDLIFHQGEPNCDQICPQQCTQPSCNNVTTADCANPNYSPKLSNFEITAAKGQRKFSLKWQDECQQAAFSYNVWRCQGGNCTNFAAIGTTNTNSFDDSSEDFLFDTAYTYQIIAHYNSISATPTIKKTASLGNLECFGQTSSNNFCIQNLYYDQYKEYLLANFPGTFKNFSSGVKSTFGNKLNRAFFCDFTNKLIPTGPICSSSQNCIVNNNQPSCINKIDCNYAGANPFGLFYTLDNCETNRYCFYDRSKTIVNSCFNCDPSMSCYDYKTEDACTRDNCRVGNCKWKNLVTQIGVGACVSTIQYNCQWCTGKGTGSIENARAFNNVFDICTKEKSSVLSEGKFTCYFKDENSKSCEDVVCSDYSPEQCSNAKITHDENNKIISPSQDECGIKVCQNINSICSKNADGDDNADCNDKLCESDYSPPSTTLLPVVKKSLTASLLVQIYDKTGINSPSSLRTSADYLTFLCVEPCGANGHPYDASTSSRKIVISNLNAYDGDNGNKLLNLVEGVNVLRYYSQDPSKNIGEVQRIMLEAHSNSSGPEILSINVSGGAKVLGKIYTKNRQPSIDVQFFEPAIVTFARISSKSGSKIITLNGNTQLSAAVSMQVPEMLANGEYNLELNAKNKNNIFMDSPVSQVIVIDDTKPIVNITPPNGAELNASVITVTLVFSKEVNLDDLKINSEDIKSSFSTTNNRVFTAAIILTDGNKNLQVSASDFAKNQVASSVSFVVYSHTNTISLISPEFAASPTFIFDLVAGTDNNAVCRQILDNNFEYDFMDPFISSGGTIHKITGFSKIASGDTSVHKLYVKCKNSHGQSSNSFDISVDTTPPQITTAFAFPNPVIESPTTTTLTVESDEPAICKFSSSQTEFDQMEEKFAGFGNNTFKLINRQPVTLDNEGNFSYYARCRNKAGLISEVKTISFNVDLSLPMSIISHTPEFFNSTNAVLAIETNKQAQCKFSESDPNVQVGELFGPPGYSHTRQISSSQGQHTFYVVCKDQFLQKFSDVKQITFTVDTTPPEMLYVNDSSTIELIPQKTCLTDRLRVKFLGQDNESSVKDYFYSIFKKLDSKIILNYTQTFIEDDWIMVPSLNLSDNTQYSFRVKARNIVNSESQAKSSDGITVDTSVCQPNPSCGDGKINQAGEDCDKAAFGAISSCTQYTNLIGGILRCNSNCKLDTSGCISRPNCGNGELDPGEACDGVRFGIIDACAKYDSSFSGGILKCNSKCELDTSACIEKPKCGNSYIDQGESCDGTNLGFSSSKCIDYNPSTFSGGNISCGNCQLDTSKCQGTQGACGDGKIDIGEVCDGASFGLIKACSDYSSFTGGALKCDANCQLDTSGCIPKPNCGNGIININESCDANFLGLSTDKCMDYSSDFSSGTIKCSNSCKLDTSGCSKSSACGNGILNTGELCDGANFGNLTDLSCNGYSSNFFNGTLKCSSCRISTADCNAIIVQIGCRDRGDCKIGDSCTANSDCEKRFCSSGKCAQPSCNDAIKNQDESDVDCGGQCQKCSNDKPCKINSDCQSSYCSFGFCKPMESCLDGKLTPGESDVDCGGHCPAKCSDGKSCSSSDDCMEGSKCESFQCKMSKQACNADSLPDSDCDGIQDDWEIKNGLNPGDPTDANADNDKDGLDNLQEYKNHTDPNLADTDGDNYTDKQEIDAGTNPLDPKDYPKTSKKAIIFSVVGLTILLSLVGFLTYKKMSKKTEKKFESPRQMEMPKFSIQEQPKKSIAKPKILDPKMREMLKQREQQKIAQRKKIFEIFGKGAEPEIKIDSGKKPTGQTMQEIKQKTVPAKKLKTKSKETPKKAKEDIFKKLREIAAEKNKKKSKSKNVPK